ncbi:hypothetical protein FOPE_04347 [Fonsecaea pedrosoi]|nr:hypothetical protein FOPE_04347 [Fonsecaea pedrosoi]
MSSPVFTDTNLDYDDESWDQSVQIYDTWKSKLLKRDNLLKIGKLIDKYRGGVPDTLSSPQKGAFNAWIRLKFVDGGSAVMRIPLPGKTMFPAEKTQREVDVMRYLSDKTSLPVPLVLHLGTAEESPNGLGPFIIMEFIEHECDLVDALNTPDIPYEERPILDPYISSERLHFVYRQMADVMLQYSKHTFMKIGSISSSDEGDSWVVSHRPLTLNMNELVQLGNVSPDALPQGPFETSTSYYTALASMHIAHLKAQRVSGMQATEFRRKYIARCLFHRLAREGRFSKYGDRGPFPLVNDDFRPANVLSNAEFQVTGVVDWEFTYAGPREFAYSAPVWLLLELPEYWPDGLDDWTHVYEQRLPIFLTAVRESETAAIKGGTLREEQCLSQFMDDSWKTGDFWVTYAARRCWAFDMVYWVKIDKRFFGVGTVDDRLELLTMEEKTELDQLLNRMFKASTSGDGDGFCQSG